MKKVKLLLLAALVAHFSAHSQALLNKYLGGCGHDFLYDALYAPPFIYLAGSSTSFNWGYGDIYLTKIDTSGNTIWSKTFRSNSGAEAAIAITQKPNGKLVILNSLPNGLTNIFEVDTGGNMLTSLLYPVANYGHFTWIRASYDNGIIAGGYRTDSVQNALVNKFDSAYNLVYSKEQHGLANYLSSWDGDSRIYSFRQASDSGFIATGAITHHFAQYPFVWKSNKGGNTTWFKIYNQMIAVYSYQLTGMYPTNYAFSDIVETGNGYLIGGMADRSSWGADPFLLKLDPSGNIVWSYAYNLPPNGASNTIDDKLSLTVLPAGKLLLTGSYDSSWNTMSSNYFAMCLDSTGNVYWAKRYGETGISLCNTSIQLNRSTLLLGHSNENAAGNSLSPVAPQFDMYALRIDSNGNCLVNSQAVNVSRAGFINGFINHNKYELSRVPSGSSNYTYTIATASTTYDSASCVGVGIVELETPTIELYPNPSAGELTLSTPTKEFMQVAVISCYGELLFETKNASSDHYALDLTSLSNGVYFVEITLSQRQKITKKLVLQR